MLQVGKPPPAAWVAWSRWQHVSRESELARRARSLRRRGAVGVSWEAPPPASIQAVACLHQRLSGIGGALRVGHVLRRLARDHQRRYCNHCAQHRQRHPDGRVPPGRPWKLRAAKHLSSKSTRIKLHRNAALSWQSVRDVLHGTRDFGSTEPFSRGARSSGQLLPGGFA
jgi:hypothetical protein